MGRFTPDFIKKRQAGLKRFLQRIDRHPVLNKTDNFVAFLEQPVVGMRSETVKTEQMSSFDALPAEQSNPDGNASSTNVSSYLTPLIDSLGDVLSATLLRSPQNVDESFLTLRKNVHTVRGHLSQLERLFSHRTTSLRPTIIEGMTEISADFDELSAAIDINLNPNADDYDSVPLGLVKAMLSRISATMTQCKTVMTKSMEGQETKMHAILAELVQYCDNALELILLRDRRQVECEELELLLQKYKKQRDEIRGFSSTEISTATETATGGSNNNNAESDEGNKNEPTEGETSDAINVSSTSPTSNTSNTAPKLASTSTPTTGYSSFMSYLSAKWDTWKGVDPITARQNRLAQLSQQISQVSAALEIAKQMLERANSTLQEEITIFESILRAELGSELKGYTTGQVHYHESSLVYWKDFLAWLENPPKHLF